MEVQQTSHGRLTATRQGGEGAFRESKHAQEIWAAKIVKKNTVRKGYK